MEFLEKVDGFRFLNNLNTQVRSLAICSQIIKEIGKSHSPKNILALRLEKWSQYLEDTSKEYINHNGRLTINKKRTRAFDRYLEFLKNLSLTNSINNIISTTPLGFLLSNLISVKNDKAFFLTDYERLFYLIELLRKDADALLIALGIIDGSRSISQKDLMRSFETNFKTRLAEKKSAAFSTVQLELGDKYRIVEYQWKNIESYSEHIIIPRVEWLIDLTILITSKSKNETTYNISERGETFYYSIPIIRNSSIRDVDEMWLNKASVKASCIALGFIDIRNWSSLKDVEQIDLLSPILEESYLILSKGGAMRMPLYPLFLTIIIRAACEKKVVIEFSDLEERFKDLKVGKRNYVLRKTSRMNESYISVSLN